MSFDISGILDSLAEKSIMADMRDLRAMGELHSGFMDISDYCHDSGFDDLGAASVATADLVEAIILGDAKFEEAISRISDAINWLQARLIFQRSPIEAPPPEFLQSFCLGNQETVALSERTEIKGDINEQTVDFDQAKNEEKGAKARSKTATKSTSDGKKVKATKKAESPDNQAEERPPSQTETEKKQEISIENTELSEKADIAPEIQDILEVDGISDHIIVPQGFDIDSFREIVSEFCQESTEHLQNTDSALLRLDSGDGNNEDINIVFRAFHTIKGVSGFLGFHTIGKLAHETETLLDLARSGKIPLTPPVMDIIFAASDMMKGLVELIIKDFDSGVKNSQNANQEVEAFVEKIKAIIANPNGQSAPLGKILTQTGKSTEEAIEKALEEQKSQEVDNRQPLGEIMIKQGSAKAGDIAQALRVQQASENNSRTEGIIKESIRIDADRLDRFLDAVGELVIAQSMVLQNNEIKTLQSPVVDRLLTQLDKITRSLQEMSTSMRMIPIKATFQKMARLVRDLSKKSGRNIELIIIGEDTELDKTVVDRISDPLVHMVRNAADHGLNESTEDRLMADKPKNGRIFLRAFHRGGSIFIEVEDDGRGLDREKILKKAIDKEIISDDGSRLSDSEIYNMIFHAGFSTAEKVTDLSGRGVGMDVVKRTITDLRGSVEISSELGKGSKFSIRLPLTLAIIDGMIIRSGKERYIVPTLSVVTSIRPAPNEIKTVIRQGEMISPLGTMIPMFRLSNLFNIEGAEEDPSNGVIMIVEDSEGQIGLLIDELLGQQQIVIKPLGDFMKDLDGISGGGIMPDGTIGLILDISGLQRLAKRTRAVSI